VQRPTMADVRKIHALLDEGDSEVAFLQAFVRSCKEAAEMLGLHTLPFDKMSDIITRIRRPFHSMEQLLQYIEESSPYRYRNKSRAVVILPDDTVLQPGHIVSLDEEERTTEPIMGYIDEGLLVSLTKE